MSTETRELHGIIRAGVLDMLDAYRIQAQTGPVSDQAPEGIIFCGSGSWGGWCLSMGDYVTRTGAHGRGDRRRRAFRFSILS